MLGHALDCAILACRITAFKDDQHFCPGLHQPLLGGDEGDLQRLKLLQKYGIGHLGFGSVVCSFCGLLVVGHLASSGISLKCARYFTPRARGLAK